VNCHKNKKINIFIFITFYFTDIMESKKYGEGRVGGTMKATELLSRMES
jgi:MarR family protease production transcriptional regulator HPr